MKALSVIASTMAVCALAVAGEQPPPVSAATAPAAGPPRAAAPGGALPDGEFIEYLGADDVGDAASWEFLKRTALHRAQRPVPPPQDAKQ